MTTQLPLPAGFCAYTGNVGVRSDDSTDIAIMTLTSDAPAPACAAVFTQSLFSGVSVTMSREHLALGNITGIVSLAGNSNVATGPQGQRNANEILATLAPALNTQPQQLLIASTGVIGRQYPMEQMRQPLTNITLSDFTADAHQIATAIMTTDTHHKVASTRVDDISIVAVAKGVGMVEPNMATMLTYFFTDAAISSTQLQHVFASVVDDTFNCLSVDTDTSTSDTAIMMASGHHPVSDIEAFTTAVHQVALDLVKQLARDGEGATKLLTVTVEGADSSDQAHTVAKTILNSPLVKTAVHGADPNWGRVAMAIGKCEQYPQINPAETIIRFGDMETYPNSPHEHDLDRLSSIMAAENVSITVDLGLGSHTRTVYGCDLSREYIAINADYTT